MAPITNRPMDGMPAVWLRRKTFQPCEVGRPAAYVLGDSRLGNLDLQHQQLTLILGAPKEGSGRSYAGSALGVRIDLSSVAAPTRAPAPVGSEAAAVPGITVSGSTTAIAFRIDGKNPRRQTGAADRGLGA